MKPQPKRPRRGEPTCSPHTTPPRTGVSHTPPHTPLTDWIDSQDVMQALHISPRTLQTLRTNGTLPFSRIGNKLYYRKQDIEKILSDNYTMYKIQSHGNK